MGCFRWSSAKDVEDSGMSQVQKKPKMSKTSQAACSMVLLPLGYKSANEYSNDNNCYSFCESQ